MCFFYIFKTQVQCIEECMNRTLELCEVPNNNRKGPQNLPHQKSAHDTSNSTAYMTLTHRFIVITQQIESLACLNLMESESAMLDSQVLKTEKKGGRVFNNQTAA